MFLYIQNMENQHYTSEHSGGLTTNSSAHCGMNLNLKVRICPLILNGNISNRKLDLLFMLWFRTVPQLTPPQKKTKTKKHKQKQKTH